MEAIQNFFPTPKKLEKNELNFTVARSFDINKPGYKIEDMTGGILGGTIKSGKIKVGQEVLISPGIKSENKGEVKWTPIKNKNYEHRMRKENDKRKGSWRLNCNRN